VLLFHNHGRWVKVKASSFLVRIHLLKSLPPLFFVFQVPFFSETCVGFLGSHYFLFMWTLMICTDAGAFEELGCPMPAAPVLF
jgi:hypothetical protein